MNYQKDVSILVNSCDRYEDAWEPFFKLFSIQWPDCPYKIILNTESKDFCCDYLAVETIHTGDCKTWTQRVKSALEKIDTEFVLFFLEDFFLLSAVNSNAWNAAIEAVRENRNIGFVWFAPNKMPLSNYKRKSIAPDLYATASDCNCRVNATVGLWRKEFFLQMLYRDGDPWQFEWSATKLSRYSNFKTTLWEQNENRVFDYEIRLEAGYGILRGKWLPKNKDLFNEYDIEVDFDNLGFATEERVIAQPGESTKPVQQKQPSQRIKALKRTLNDIKRLPKLYPAFKKHCRAVKKGISDK